MSSTRQNAAPRILLVGGLVLFLAVAWAAPAAAQPPRPSPTTVSNVPLVPVVGAAKQEFLNAMLANKRGIQLFRPAQPEECVDGTSTVVATTCGSTSSGELATSDCKLSDNSYYDLFSFSGTAGQQVTITMTSTAFDTYLALFDPTLTDVAEDDDSGGGTNSRIVFTLGSSGTWVIVANSLPANVFGAYTLTLECTGGGSSTCTPNSTTLCLNNGRFRVQATFATPAGQSGDATAVLETSDTGLFWFFSANNIEVIIKVLNACSFAGGPRYWVFAGGLTNVEVVLTVTDTQTQTVRTYRNPQGTAFAPIQDTNAFATCP